MQSRQKRNNVLYIIVKTQDIQRKEKIIIEICQRKSQVKETQRQHKNTYKKTYYFSISIQKTKRT